MSWFSGLIILTCIYLNRYLVWFPISLKIFPDYDSYLNFRHTCIVSNYYSHIFICCHTFVSEIMFRTIRYINKIIYYDLNSR